MTINIDVSRFIKCHWIHLHNHKPALINAVNHGGPMADPDYKHKWPSCCKAAELLRNSGCLTAANPFVNNKVLYN